MEVEKKTLPYYRESVKRAIYQWRENHYEKWREYANEKGLENYYNNKEKILEKAKKKYEEEQRRRTGNSNFRCSTNDSDFLRWYAVLNSGSSSCTTNSTVDYSPSCSSSSHRCSSSSSYDSGSSYSDSGSSSSSCD